MRPDGLAFDELRLCACHSRRQFWMVRLVIFAHAPHDLIGGCFIVCDEDNNAAGRGRANSCPGAEARRGGDNPADLGFALFEPWRRRLVEDCHDDVRLSFGTVSRDVEDDLTLEDGWWRWFPITQCLSKHIRCERDSFGAGFGRFAHGESQTARIGTGQAPDTKALDAPEQGRDLVVVLEHGVRWIGVDAQNRV